MSRQRMSSLFFFFFFSFGESGRGGGRSCSALRTANSPKNEEVVVMAKHASPWFGSAPPWRGWWNSKSYERPVSLEATTRVFGNMRISSGSREALLASKQRTPRRCTRQGFEAVSERLWCPQVRRCSFVPDGCIAGYITPPDTM